MAVNPTVKVGIIVFISLVALAIVAIFLTDYQLMATGYNIIAIYDDVYGLTADTEVRMAGVKIGKVDTISLDRRQRAVVKIRVSSKCRIPEGSQFVLQMGLLIGDKYIDILPNRNTDKYLADGSVVNGKIPPSLTDLVPDAQKLIGKLNETADGLNRVLNNKEYQERLNASLKNIQNATARLDQTMYLLQNTVKGQQQNINAIASNVTYASASLKNLMSDLEGFEKRGDVQANIIAALDAARKSAESLERTTDSLEKLLNDPNFQADIKGTAAEARAAMTEARETAEQAKEIVERIGQAIGVGGHSPGIKKTELPTRSLNIDTLIRPDDGIFRATISTTVPTSARKFLRLGIFDVGGTNKLILQPGRSADSRTDLRYGLYASRFGVGVDHSFSRKTSASLDLFDPDAPKLNFQGAYEITDDQGLLLGVDDMFGKNQFTLGMRFTR